MNAQISFEIAADKSLENGIVMIFRGIVMVFRGVVTVTLSVPRVLRIWRRRARTRRELSRLEPRLLRDIGVHDALMAAEIRKWPWQA